MLLRKTLISFLCLWLVHGQDIQSGPPYSNSTSLPGASSQSPAPASVSDPPITSSDPPAQSASESLPVSTDVATSDTSAASSNPRTTDPATQTTSNAPPESSTASTSAASTSDGGGAGSGGAAAVGGAPPGGLPGSPSVDGGSGGGGGGGGGDGDGSNGENNDQQSNTSQESQSSTESSTQSSTSEASSTTSGCAFPSDLPPDQDETVQFPSPTWDLDAPDFPTPVWSVIFNNVDLPPVTVSSQDPTTTKSPTEAPTRTETLSTQVSPYQASTDSQQSSALASTLQTRISSAAAASSTHAADVGCSITSDTVGHISQLSITNVTPFAGLQGQKLEDALRSCGHVYAWEFDSDKGRVDFSISSQDVDAGCVEGSIKSAGGPSATCNVGSNPIEIARRWYQAQWSNESVPVNFTVPGRYDRRVRRWETAQDTATVAEVPVYHDTQLSKRGVFSDPDPTKVDNSIWSAAAIPGVDECKDHISAKGLVGTKSSIFYTAWSRGKDGYENSKAWARKNKCRVGDIVYWDIMYSPKSWQSDVETAIAEPYALLNQQTGSLSKQFLFNGGRKYTEDFLNQNSLRFLENLSQAYAELTKGEAWLFMPDGSGAWSDSSAWGAFEYPALTRNPDVTKIWRVNVAGDFFDPTGEPTLIWDRSRGDGPSPFDAKGTRERTNPPDSPLTEVSPAPPVNP